MGIIQALLLGDVHRPFHDEYAWELALKIVEAEKPEIVAQVGDLGDFHAVSRHPKKFGREQVFARELEGVQAGTREFISASSHRKLRLRIILQGNHEESFERYVAWNAPQIEGLVPDGPSLIGFPLSERNVWVPYRDSIDIGKVTLVHDIGHSGRNAVMQNLTAAGRNIVGGHTHGAGIEWGGTTHGDAHFSMIVGWLGDKSKITYLHPNQMRHWRQGLGQLLIDERTGFVWPTFIPFVGYSAVVNGSRYAVRGPSMRRAA